MKHIEDWFFHGRVRSALEGVPCNGVFKPNQKPRTAGVGNICIAGLASPTPLKGQISVMQLVFYDTGCQQVIDLLLASAQLFQYRPGVASQFGHRCSNSQ